MNKNCRAKQHSDQMVCGDCGNVWDMNDPEPPICGLMNDEQRKGFLLAVEMIRDSEDSYGIGNWNSQWDAESIADDLLERMGLKP